MDTKKLWIKNWDKLISTPEREKMLAIVHSAFDAIDTEQIVQQNVRVEDETLFVKKNAFDLKKFDRVFVIAIGKGAARAATQLHLILGANITHSIVLDKVPLIFDGIEAYQGTHPVPSRMNLHASS